MVWLQTPASLGTRVPTTFPDWAPDDSTDACTGCEEKFSFFRRKQYVACCCTPCVPPTPWRCLTDAILASHCRNCGLLFCYQCSNHFVPVPALDNAVSRVCDSCNHLLLQATTGPAAASSSATGQLLAAAERPRRGRGGGHTSSSGEDV